MKKKLYYWISLVRRPTTEIWFARAIDTKQRGNPLWRRTKGIKRIFKKKASSFDVKHLLRFWMRGTGFNELKSSMTLFLITAEDENKNRKTWLFRFFACSFCFNFSFSYSLLFTLINNVWCLCHWYEIAVCDLQKKMLQSKKTTRYYGGIHKGRYS